jgi:ATP-dependent DNA helicase RecG
MVESAMATPSPDQLVPELTRLPKETEWVEFKTNNANPYDIGEYISALSNSAALVGRERGYMVWGVRDEDHEVVGTDFRPNKEKVKGQELENFLTISLHPQVHFEFYEGEVDAKRVVVLEIAAANHTPVRFIDTEYIRVGSYKKKLRDHQEKERALWATLSSGSFEEAVAHADASGADVVALLDYPSVFRLLEQPVANSADEALRRLVAEGLIASRGPDRYDIKNVAAILFARDLGGFGRLSRKALRIVSYDGKGRTKALREHVVNLGYATGFQVMLDYLDSQVPRREIIEHGLRKELRDYPADSIRESLGNALIHQDLSLAGAGPLVEIFSDRIEITNPGAPLVDPKRILDLPPRSRNEVLATLMRRVRICEERGTGIDKVVQAAEDSMLPAPEFIAAGDNTRVVIYGPRSFAEMTQGDRLRATYQHASLQWVSNQRMTNASLRQRFGISEGNAAMVSRVIGESVEDGLIKPFDPRNKSRRLSQYIPFWA